MKVIRQRDFKDCGVTCIQYLIEYYKGYVPIEKLRSDTFTNQNGTTAYNIVETLKKYQFDSYGMKTTFNELEHLVCPLIVHLVLDNGMHHFAVLTKIRHKVVYLMDPAQGKLKLKKEEFERIWDNVIILAFPLKVLSKMSRERNTLLTLVLLCQKEKKYLFEILAFSLLVSLLTIITSLYLKIGIEHISIMNKNEWYIFTSSFALLFIFKMILDYGKNYWKLYLDKNIEADYLYSFLSHLFCLPLEKFQSYHEGDIITRVEEATEIKDLFEDICITFFLESILGVFAIFVLFSMNSRLTILVLIGLCLYCVLGVLTSKPFYRLVLENMKMNRKWNENILENVQMFTTMKHLNQTSDRVRSLENGLCEKLNLQIKQQFWAMFYHKIRENFLEILFFLIMTYGMYLISKNELSILDFITFQSLYLYFVTPFKELANLGPKFYYMKGIIQKISETFALPIEELKEYEYSDLQDIKVSHVSFSYNQIMDQLKDVNFKIKGHEHVFLDGPSGCGKSTFCHILHGDYANYKGDILIQNKNLKDYELSVIRSSIIYLSQRENLIGGSIKENILFGSEENDDFNKVTKICELEDIVKTRPFRYESFINNEMLSGGEKQRIMLARTLLKKGSIYLLDEALSEVEESLEIKIIQNIRKYLKGKTLIYISHKDHSNLFERRVTFDV